MTVATSDDAKQSIINAIKVSADDISRMTSSSTKGEQIRALAEAWAIVRDQGAPQVY